MTRSLFASAFALIAVSAATAAPLDSQLDFNDGLIPPGWVLENVRPGAGGSMNYGIGGGVLYAGPVDSGAYLHRDYTPTPGATALLADWQGSVFETFWGNGVAFSVFSPSGSQVTMGISSKQFDTGPGVRFFVRTNNTNYNFQQLSVPAGGYNFSGVFLDGSATLTASLAGNIVYQHTEALPGFVLSEQSRLQFTVFLTDGPHSWADNVYIREQVAAVPEPSTALMWALGLACMLGATRGLVNKARSCERSDAAI